MTQNHRVCNLKLQLLFSHQSAEGATTPSSSNVITKFLMMMMMRSWPKPSFEDISTYRRNMLLMLLLPSKVKVRSSKVGMSNIGHHHDR
jgi:hypothetical protein